MKPPNDTKGTGNIACGCGHDHGHAHDHGHDHAHDHSHEGSVPLAYRWISSLVIIAVLLLLLKPFIVSQMLVRVTSYSTSASYNDAVRICKKIVFIAPDNVQAWTSLGYAYMDLGDTDEAIAAFNRVLSIDPDDKGAASFELGQAYYKKADFTDAIAAFERVRLAGPRAATLLEADVLKYRHGTLGFRNLNSMETLLDLLSRSYAQTGNAVMAAEVQKEREQYKARHSHILF